MCGIAGIYLKRRDLSTTRFPVERMADELLLNIASRGRHATGLVATNRDGSVIHMQKDNVPAEFFTQYRDYLPEDTKTLLMHTRFATQGAAEQNENNHPVVYGGTYVTHNGVVYNDDWLFQAELMDVKRVAEVDSIVFPTMIEEWGWDKIKESLTLVQGSYAVACIQPEKHPDELIIARGESSPVHYYETDQAIVWASEQWHLQNAWKDTYGTPPSTTYYLDEGQMLVVKNDKVEVERYMEKPQYLQPTYTSHRSTRSYRTGWAWEDNQPTVEKRGTPNQDCIECGERLGVKAIWGDYSTDTHDCKWRVWVCMDCFKNGKNEAEKLDWAFVTEPIESWYTEKGTPKTRNIGTIQGDSPYVDEFLSLQPGQVIPTHLVDEAFSDADCETCGSWDDIYALDDDGMPLCRECYLMATDTTETTLHPCENCDVYVKQLTLTMLGNICDYCVRNADPSGEARESGFDVCGTCNKVKRVKQLSYRANGKALCFDCLPDNDEFDLDAAFARFLESYRESNEDLYETDESLKLVAEEYRMPPGLLTWICYRADTGGDRQLLWARHSLLTAVGLAVKAANVRKEATSA